LCLRGSAVTEDGVRVFMSQNENCKIITEF
jgi:hypothetical protein